MSPTEVHGPGWAWWAPLLVAIAALGTAAATPALAPHGLFPEPLWLLVALLIAAVGAMHRPFGGGSLSLGALMVLPGFDRLGVAPVAWIAGLALVLAELALRFVESRRELPLPERRSATRIAAAVSVTIVGVVAAGAVDRLGIASAALALSLIALAWVAPHGLLEALARRARREPGDGFLETMQPLLLDLCGLLLERSPWRWSAPPGSSSVCWRCSPSPCSSPRRRATGSRLREVRGGSTRRRSCAAPASRRRRRYGLLAAAEQIRAECAALFSYSWFQLDLDLPGEDRMSWARRRTNRSLRGRLRRRACHRRSREFTAGAPGRSSSVRSATAAHSDGSGSGAIPAARAARPRAARRPAAADGGFAARGAGRTRCEDRSADRKRASRRVLESRLGESFARAPRRGAARWRWSSATSTTSSGSTTPMGTPPETRR
ncbi:MAG: hypothetical protein R2862_08315 [Thermoanaerobaculia bacterium]